MHVSTVEWPKDTLTSSIAAPASSEMVAQECRRLVIGTQGSPRLAQNLLNIPAI